MKKRFHMKMRAGFCLVAGILLFGISFTTKAQEEMKQSEQRIEIIINEQVLTATLNSSKAARDFLALLPLTLTLEDYADTEKSSDLPERLSTEDAPAGSEASAGDIAFFEPWGNLAIFYKDFRYSKGLIILGTIKGDIEILKESGSLQAEIRRVE